MFTHIGTTHIDKNRENLFTFSGTENTFLLFDTNHVCQLGKLPMYHYPKITTALISDNADRLDIRNASLQSLPPIQEIFNLFRAENLLWTLGVSSVVVEPFLTCHMERKTGIPTQMHKEDHVLWSQKSWVYLTNYVTVLFSKMSTYTLYTWVVDSNRSSTLPFIEWASCFLSALRAVTYLIFTALRRRFCCDSRKTLAEKKTQWEPLLLIITAFLILSV